MSLTRRESMDRAIKREREEIRDEALRQDAAGVASGGGGGGTTWPTLAGAFVEPHSASYAETATAGIHLLLVNASGGAVTITLPTAVGNEAILIVKKDDASANTVTVDGAGAELIDGAATAVLAVEDESISLASDGAGWAIF
jgi:hypothetical protein